MLNDSSAYFSINHPFDAYLQAWDNNQPLPTIAQLSLMLPPSLQLISDIKSLESDCLLQLRHLDDDAKTVVEFLKLQSRKIDMVLQHVMRNMTVSVMLAVISAAVRLPSLPVKSSPLAVTLRSVCTLKRSW